MYHFMKKNCSNNSKICINAVIYDVNNKIQMQNIAYIPNLYHTQPKYVSFNFLNYIDFHTKGAKILTTGTIIVYRFGRISIE